MRKWQLDELQEALQFLRRVMREMDIDSVDGSNLRSGIVRVQDVVDYEIVTQRMAKEDREYKQRKAAKLTGKPNRSK